MSIKKTIITTVAVLVMVAVVAPGVAQGVTIEELLAQIAQLQAQLMALQGGTTPVPTGNVACAGVTFTRNLTVGSTGQDVKCLQVLLNTNGYTLASTGAGSPGMETSYFGPITLGAVRAFQVAKGWTPANQVGPLTRGALNALLATTPVTPTTPGTPVTPPITTPGAEGSIAVTKSATPASGAEINVGGSKAVIAVDVKATGSDVVLNRLDLNFDNSMTGTNCTVRPWTYLSSVTVSDGTTSKNVVVTSDSTLENTVGSDYTVRVESLGMIVPKDVTKKVTATFNAVSALPAGATSCATSVEIDANGVRATDGVGVSQYNANALTANNFTVKTGDTGTLTLSSHPDTPKANNFIGSETANTDVVLMKFNLEAKSNDVILRTVRVQAYSSSSTLATTMPTVRLLDGATDLASTSTAATSTFDALNLTIPAGTTKTLTVVGTVADVDTTTVSEGDYVNVTIETGDITSEDSTTFGSITAGGSTVTGAAQYAYLKAPTFALVSASIANVPGTSGSLTQQANATIKFNVTATGGDIYVRNVSTTAASSGIVARQVIDTGSASSTLSQTFTTNATSGTDAWRVASGDTKWFEVSGLITQTEISGFWESMNLLNVKWATTDDATDAGYTTQTWGLDDIKTGSAYLNPTS